LLQRQVGASASRRFCSLLCLKANCKETKPKAPPRRALRRGVQNKMLKKILSFFAKDYLKEWQAIVEKINSLEKEFEKFLMKN
jgi:hypothetical protein